MELYFTVLQAGKEGYATGELCFNTGMTGYQESIYRPLLLWAINDYN